LPETDVRELQRTRVSSWLQFAILIPGTHHHRFDSKTVGHVQMHRCQHLREIQGCVHVAWGDAVTSISLKPCSGHHLAAA
jgi:hypothetical protein